jgi:pimeloyl-ACP methyl ester carboxylesterase
MKQIIPHVREAGAGPGVVCLHANASSSSQWRALLNRLSARYHVLAPDSLGAGKSPPWPDNRVATLRDEVAFLAPVFDAAGPSFSLVGHSYGASVALIAALTHPDRVRAIAVYEPTLFALLEEEKPLGREAAHGIRCAVDDAAAAIAAHDHVAAGRRFIDYWMGHGSWDQMAPAQQDSIAMSMENVAGWGRALFSDPTPLRTFASLRLPVLCMVGARSPASSRGVARLLAGVLPDVTVIEFSELGHMGPVTHPETVNDAVADFLARWES